eukprot:g1169.t1
MKKLAFAAALLAKAALATPPVPPDPVMPQDFPDPTAVFFEGKYYAFGGQHGMSSPDLKTWSRMWLYLDGTPAWADHGGAGAPGRPMQVAADKWPFKPVDEVVVCMPEQNYVVDANPRKLASGEHVLYFKSTGFNTLQRPAMLWVNLLNQTQQWEARNGMGCIEAPALLQTGGRNRLFYSGGDWTAGEGGTPYSIGYADCESPLGPCSKVTKQRPWFGPSYNDTVGDGGQDFFTDDSGRDWVVFHAWQKGRAGYNHGGERTVRFYPLVDLPALH